jgi:hypothetical protein
MLTLLAAYLVGPNGMVLGVDRDADMLEIARNRARNARLDQVYFLDAGKLGEEGPFDAVITHHAGLHATLLTRPPASRSRVGEATPAPSLADYSPYAQHGRRRAALIFTAQLATGLAAMLPRAANQSRNRYIWPI